MASHPPLLFSLLLLPLLILLSSTNSLPSSPDSNLVADLKSLRSQSPDGVIHLNDNLLRRIVSHKRRSFFFLVFFDAAHLHHKSELQLPALRSQFAVVSSSFLENHKDDHGNNAAAAASLSKLFFFVVEFKESQHTFSIFDVNTLPHIRLVNPTLDALKDSDHLPPGSFNSLTESLVQFILTKSHLSIGPIHRPPVLSRTQLAFIAVVLLIWAPFAIEKVVSGDTFLHDYKLWLTGSIFVYFFSVSGTMYNIIRKMPMFMVDRKSPSKLVFFYKGSGVQLGTEGFAIGFLYTVVGLLLAMMTHGLVKVRNLNLQRFAMVIAMIMCFWAVKKVVYLDNWKTGYAVHGYWPSSS